LRGLSECIFCKIVRGEADAYIVYRGHGVTAFLDKFPVSKGHLLVVPDEHYESIHDTPLAKACRVWAVASAIAKYYRVKLGAPGVNLLTNSGSYAGQVIFHFHVHVIPRWGPMRGFFAGRHSLTEEEAREVMGMLEGVGSFVEEELAREGCT